MSLDYQKLAAQLLGTQQAQQLGRSAGELSRLAHSPDGERVRQLMGDEAEMARALEQGDAQSLKRMMENVLGTPEGERLIRQLSRLLE